MSNPPFKDQKSASEFVFEPMEPRILLSADALGVDISYLNNEVYAPEVDEIQGVHDWWNTEESHGRSIVSGPEPSGPPIHSAPNEIVFLDAGVVDGEVLLTELLKHRESSELQVHLINAGTDGVQQITNVLQHSGKLDAVHVISHGASGQLQLGDAILSSTTLPGYLPQFAAWGEALSDSADILFYGCDLVATDSGKELVQAISDSTGADVAASNDKTGSAEQGGDWELESRTGYVEVDSFAVNSESTWSGTLATVTVDTFDDLADGGDVSSVSSLIADPGSDGISLREAIIATNSDAGADAIVLSAGTYTLSIAGDSEGLAATGDLDIRDSLTIEGAGADLTTIDGADLDRVIQITPVTNITVTISDLKIQNGSVAERGAAIFIGNTPGTSTVELNNVWIADNHAPDNAGYGGAIFNRGDLSIKDSLLEGNSAANGGAIANFTDGTLNLTNVTMSGNSATFGSGGALFNAESANLVNVTVAENNASISGGGLHTATLDLSATTTLQNTLVANNTAPLNADTEGVFVSASGDNLIESPGAATGLHGNDITGVDPNISDLQAFGGPTPVHVLLEGSSAINFGSESGAPAADQRGVARDDNLPDIGAFEIANDSRLDSAMFSTADNVSGSGVIGPSAWNLSSVMNFDLGLQSLSTFGTISHVVDFDSMGLNGEGISAIHYVGKDITIGASNAFDLKLGDLILSVNKNGQTLNSNNSIAVDEDDVFVFRPDTPGDYSQGTFSLLLDRAQMPGNIEAITLVEERTLVGDVVLEVGDFLFAAAGGDDNSISRLVVDSTGLGTTTVGNSLLIDGDDISMAEKVGGLELLEANTTVGGLTLKAGQILVSSLADQADVGNAPTISADKQDVFVLDVANAGAGTTAATAFMLIDGSVLRLDSDAEAPISFTLIPELPNREQAILTNTGISVAENGSGSITTASLETTDAENSADQIVYTITALPLNGDLNDGVDNYSINDTFTQEDLDTTGITYNHNGAESPVESFEFRVDDGEGVYSEGTFVISIDPVNDEQAVVTNLPASVDEGAIDNVITTAMLETEDPDNTALELVYSVTAIPYNGLIELSGSELAVNDTFTQDDIDNNRLTYDHDGSETAVDAFSFNVDDGQNFISSDTFNINVNAVDDDAVITHNTGATFDEGSSDNAITYWMLLATDSDNTAAEVVYSIINLPAHGELKLNGTTLGSNSTFTQQDVNDGLLRYSHNGSESPVDSFDFNVSDGGGGVAAAASFSIAIEPLNDAQAVTTNTGATVNEGELNTVISTVMLEATDPDNSAAELVYGISVAPSNGTLKLNGTGLVTDDSFTQDDIDNNRLTYDHDGSETTVDEFVFSVDDGQDAASGGTFYLTINPVNDEQQLLTNSGMSVSEGSNNNLISNSILLVADSDNTASQLVYTISTLPEHGSLLLSDLVLSPGGTFTQDDIGHGRVSYNHNGSESTGDSFIFDVDDGLGLRVYGTFTIDISSVNDEPIITTNTGASLNEGDTGVVISTAMLETTDPDNATTDLIYKVTTAPNSGVLALSGNSLVVNSTFTQDDIDNNRLAYDHDGSELMNDAFGFEVDDGQNTASNGIFDLFINPVNDEETLATNTGLTVDEGDSNTIIVNSFLQTTDADNAAAEIVYNLVNSPSYGELKLNAITLVSGNAYTQENIDNGELSYSHNGAESPVDIFDFVVDDGEGANNSGSFSITVNPINDEQELAINTGMSVNEGAIGATITAAMLQTTDNDHDASSLMYTVSASPEHGVLSVGGISVVSGDTFTQHDIDQGRVTYDHDGSEANNDDFAFNVNDGVGIASTGTFNMAVAPVNDEPEISVNTGISVVEGDLGTVISTTMLESIDSDNTSDDLIYSVTTIPVNGLLKLNSVNLDMNDTFSQDDIDQNRLSYDHDGGETTDDLFGFIVDDGLSATSGDTFNVTIIPANDEQILATNTHAGVVEGSTGNLITRAMLETTDSDNPAAEIVYTLTVVTVHGPLSLDGAALSVGDTFTQEDINQNRITYDHDGSSRRLDDFQFQVDDGMGATSTGRFDILISQVNDEQNLDINTGVSLQEGESGIAITNTMLQTNDEDNTSGQIIYTVTAIPENGVIHLDGLVVSQNDLFTQNDIDNNRLSYDHDGSESVQDSFEFSVDDGLGLSTTDVFNINIVPVNDEQELMSGSDLVVSEGSTDSLITTAVLNTTDVDNTAEQILYTITAVPDHGVISLAGSELSLDDTFSQRDIDENRLTYSHNGSETILDSLNIEVDDGTGDSTSGTVGIAITPVNDEQEIFINAGLTVVEGSTEATISESELSTADVDNTPAELVYTIITLPQHGEVTIEDRVLGENETFTQDMIDRGLLAYSHDGGESLEDTIELTVDDSAGTVSSVLFNVQVLPENDAPVVNSELEDQSASEDEPFVYSIPAGTFSDADPDDQMIYSAVQADGTELPDWLSFDPANLEFSGTPIQSDVGSLAVSVIATDTAGVSVSGDFELTVLAVNDPPALINNSLVLEPGDTLTVTTQMLAVEDVDTQAEDLVFTLVDVLGGQFELKSDPGTPIETFSQTQLADGSVVFVDDGDSIAPSFQIIVDDGLASFGPVAASIDFEEPSLGASIATPTELPADIDLVIPNESPPIDFKITPQGNDVSAQTTSTQANAAEQSSEAAADNNAEFPTDRLFDEPESGNLEKIYAIDPIRHSIVSSSDSNDAIQNALAQLLAKNTTLLNVLSGPFDLDPLSSEIRSVLTSAGFQSELNQMRSEINTSSTIQQVVIGSSIAVSSGLSVGYVAWLVRGGVLLSTVLSSMPAWQFVDPLPVLSQNNGRDDHSGNEESLQDIIRRKSDKAAKVSGANQQDGSNAGSSDLSNKKFHIANNPLNP